MKKSGSSRSTASDSSSITGNLIAFANQLFNPSSSITPQTSEKAEGKKPETSIQGINAHNAKGQTALHKAVKSKYGSTGYVESLLSTPGINIDEKNDASLTALHYAAMRQKNELVRTLREKGASIDVVNKSGNTPLHMAAMENSNEIVQLLADSTVIDKLNNAGQSALHLAVKYSKEENVRTLLEKKADVDLATARAASSTKLSFSNSGKSTPLHYAFHNNPINIGIVKLLIDKQASASYLDEKGRSVAYLALSHKEIDTLTAEQLHYLLNTRAIFATTNKSTVLHAAASNTAVSKLKFEAVLAKALGFRFLVENKELAQSFIDTINDEGNTALYTAVCAKNADKVALLLEKGANPNVFKDTPPLCKAAQIKETAIAIQLLEKGADPNAMDKSNGSVLYYAARHGDVELITELYKHKATFSGEEGKKAVEIALLNNHIKALTTLIQCGASADVHVSFEESSVKSSIMSVSSYCDYSDPYDKDKTGLLRDGDTPLHFAVRSNNPELAKACLLQNKSLINSVNSGSMTPAFDAVKTLNQEMAQLLHELGAKIEENVKCQKTGRFNTLLMQGAQRGFDDIKIIVNFFRDKNFKLSPRQEEIKLEVTPKPRIQPVRAGVSRSIFKSVTSTVTATSVSVVESEQTDDTSTVESTTDSQLTATL